MNLNEAEALGKNFQLFTQLGQKTDVSINMAMVSSISVVQASGGRYGMQITISHLGINDHWLVEYHPKLIYFGWTKDDFDLNVEGLKALAKEKVKNDGW